MDAVLPERTPIWQHLERTMQALFSSYGYDEIRLPIVERTELFKRSIGEVTDIVEKEMYTFDDRSEGSLSLRPEGTAGCVRAVIDKGLIHNQQQRLWYAGPMFRYEKPQEGRYRQFNQIGVESFGFADSDIEFEHLLMINKLWGNLGLNDVKLEINSLGTLDERKVYKTLLVKYYEDNKSQLDDDSIRRLTTNPMRILDSKNPDLLSLNEKAPKLIDSLGEESKAKFDSLINLVSQAKINYEVNPRLVRGLDYYSQTVYEWTTLSLGAQGTICAGGRYDSLIEQLGGRKNSAMGFAIGADRVILLLEKLNLVAERAGPAVYVVAVGNESDATGFNLAEQLRQEFPRKTIKMNCGGGSFKSQMKRADRSGALIALILGEDEVKNQEVTLKYLREEGKQIKIKQVDLCDKIREELGE